MSTKRFVVEMDEMLARLLKNSNQIRIVKIVETGESSSYATRREAQEFIDQQENPDDWDVDVFSMGNKVRYAAVNKARFANDED